MLTRQAEKSNSPALTPVMNAFHSSAWNVWCPFAGAFESLTATSPFGRGAISTQPLTLHAEEVRHFMGSASLWVTMRDAIDLIEWTRPNRVTVV